MSDARIHIELDSQLKNLGFPGQGGLCHGFSLTAAQQFHKERLQDLIQFHKKIEDKQFFKKVLKFYQENKNNDLLLECKYANDSNPEILNYLKLLRTIRIYQSPEKYLPEKYHPEKNNYVDQGNYTTIGQFLGIEPSKMLVSVDLWCTVYLGNELQRYLIILNHFFKNQDQNTTLLLHRHNHTTALFYDVKQKLYYYIDINENDPFSPKKKLTDFESQIAKSLETPNFIMTTIISPVDQINKIKSSIHLIKENPDFQTIHAITKEKSNLNIHGNTLAHLLARIGDLEGLINLERFNVNLNQVNDFGHTPLRDALHYNQYEAIKFLYQKYKKATVKKKVFKLANLKNKLINLYNMTPLSVAYWFNRKHSSQKVVIDSNNPLEYSLFLNAQKSMETLLECKADITSTDNDENSLLIKAVGFGHQNITRLLTKESRLINKGNKKGQTPAIISVLCNDEKTLRILADCHADLKKCDHQFNSPAKISAENGQIKILKLLKEYKVDIDSPCLNGKSYLQVAEEVSQGRAMMEETIQRSLLIALQFLFSESDESIFDEIQSSSLNGLGLAILYNLTILMMKKYFTPEQTKKLESVGIISLMIYTHSWMGFCTSQAMDYICNFIGISSSYSSIISKCSGIAIYEGLSPSNWLKNLVGEKSAFLGAMVGFWGTNKICNTIEKFVSNKKHLSF